MIDAGILEPWPPEVIAAVARFKQGDLVERPPFFYYAALNHGLWDFTRDQGNAGGEGELLVLDPEDSPPYGLITTQTCDLSEQRPTPQQPWFKVAPVYEASDILQDSNRQRQVQQRQIGHLVLLTGPTLAPGLWVADLRIEVPLEKGWLVGRERIEGFATEAEYLSLAKCLGRRYDRPALDNAVSNCVVRSLRKRLHVLKGQRKADLVGELQELRLATDGPRMKVTSAQLVVFTHKDLPPALVTDWFDAWWDTARIDCEGKGLTLLFSRYTTLAKMAAVDYESTIPLDFDYLSPDE